MASGYLVNRGVLALGIHCRNVSKNILFTQTREKKRWMKAYTHIMAAKLKIEGPPPPKPRCLQPNWDYHAEVQAFSVRLHESFSLELLKTAFINPSYLISEQEKRRSAGMDAATTALSLIDNTELSKLGLGFTEGFLTDWCQASFPNLPSEGVAAVVGYLTSHTVVCHVAKNLAIGDLVMTAECPVSEEVLHSTFMAVIGALQQSSGPERAGFFLRDFVVSQLIGKELFEMWNVVNPMGLLVDELSRRNLPLPEPRLIRAAGHGTAVPLYFIGLYSDKKLLAEAPGETVFAAEEESARVALRKLYGFTENRKPSDYSASSQQPRQPAVQSLSSG